MIIAGYAVGADKGYIYIRGEYQAVGRTTCRGQSQIAREMGLLGEDIFGSGFDFDIEVFKGAGAYVCGEETALLESLEGTTGRIAGEAAVSRRLRDCGPQPTVINNVETLANIPHIIAERRRLVLRHRHREEQGNQDLLARAATYCSRACIEVPFGVTMREVHLRNGGRHRSPARSSRRS